MSMADFFNTAARQGWDQASEFEVVEAFIIERGLGADLAAFAAQFAAAENAEAERWRD